MKYIVAVSGGVDSVVLLNILSKSNHTLAVAHVDHGIRKDSAADARFVMELARQYGVPFVTKRFELGASASEEQARSARHGFLREQAQALGALIVTAHHRDDVIETIAINVQRGTGWRGLAVMGDEKIVRPLLPMTKLQIYDYAVRNRLEWVEDSTNASDVYLRNRTRKQLNRYMKRNAQAAITRLRARQLQLRREIVWESERVLAMRGATRHFITMLDQPVAIELLGTVVERQAGIRPTRPQLERALLAIKTAKPRTHWQIGNGINIYITSRNFTVNKV